ncbi:hypothetical protein TIFTF001_032618 [Ficus carica]|uniref:Cytochrome P450 n=1 Tax=Ficus carica TaxID=3494 RepID=A0AA88DX01_FICCA|nr:hypothetical protein TIFTF001_032618 [Ficus carica]
MDFQFSSFPILVCLFCFVFTLLNILKRPSKSITSTSKLPPGPWKLPITGNLQQLLGSFPHHAFRDLAGKYGPLMPSILLSQILLFDSTDIVFCPYGEHWRQVRKICTQELLTAIFSSTYTITARAAFGKKNKDQEEFILLVKEYTKIASGLDLADVFPSLSFLHPLIFGTRAKLEKLHQKSDRLVDNIP